MIVKSWEEKKMLKLIIRQSYKRIRIGMPQYDYYPDGAGRVRIRKAGTPMYVELTNLSYEGGSEIDE